jgi:hypothetical protein
MDLNSLNMVCVLHFTIANFERNLALFSVLDVSSLAKAGSIRGFEEPTLIKSLNSKFDFIFPQTNWDFHTVKWDMERGGLCAKTSGPENGLPLTPQNHSHRAAASQRCLLCCCILEHYHL